MSFHPRSIPAPLPHSVNVTVPGYVIGACLDRHRDDPRAGLREFVSKRQPRTARVTLQSRQQFANNRMVPPPPPLSRDWIFEHDVTRD